MYCEPWPGTDTTMDFAVPIASKAYLLRRSMAM